MPLYVRKKKSGNLFAKKPELGSDGLLVEIINSFPSSQTFLAEYIQKSDVLFIQAAINPSGEYIVAGDCHGNLFVFDFTRNRFNLVKHLSVPCSRLNFSLKKKQHFLVALSDYSLRCYNSENHELLACLRGHDSAIIDIAIHPSGRYALTTSSETAFLWNLDTFERKRKLSITQSVGLMRAFFIPKTNSIMTCFKDNSLFVWDAETMEMNYELKSTMAADVSYRTFDCSSDGVKLAAAGRSNVVHIWDLHSRKIVKALQLPEETKAVRQISFLPPHLFKDDVLVAVGSNGTARFINMATSSELFGVGSYEHKVTQVDFASKGGLMVCLMDSGNLNVYNIDTVLKQVQLTTAKAAIGEKLPPAEHQTIRVKTRPGVRTKEIITQKIDNSKTLNSIKLKEILREYGEFPEKYRNFIWKTILKLPENYEAYSALLQKGIHPSYVDLHKVYPIRSQKLLRVFQRLLSAVAYWAPVVTECTFLPLIAFPFAKLLQNNQLIAFEVVASVLFNWCQKWWDFIPNPPLNILAMIENVMAYHDKELFQHFVKYRVTAQIYAWSLLETGFSEVFTKNEWMKLWDHILINQPAWMLMAVVAYSLINRGPLLECYELAEFKQFFRHQNAAGVTQLVKETYKIVETTPSDLNPQINLEYYRPLNSEQYQLLAKFPHRIKNFQQNEIDRIRKEQLELMKSDDLIAWKNR